MPETARQPTLYQSGITGAAASGNAPGGMARSISTTESTGLAASSVSTSSMLIVGTMFDLPVSIGNSWFVREHE
jgi:hypothetical protein